MVKYVGIRDMTTPVSTAHVIESEDGADTILVNSSAGAYKVLSWEEQSRRVELMQAEVNLLRRQIEDATEKVDEAVSRAKNDVAEANDKLDAEKSKVSDMKAEVDKLNDELTEANAKIAVLSSTLKAVTKQLEDAMTFEDAVATMQEFNRCSSEDQRFKKYVLRRACTHLESVWKEAKAQYPDQGGISGVPALVPIFEVERIVSEAVDRIQEDAANYKF